MTPIIFLIVLDDTLSKAIDESNRGIGWNFTSHLEDLDYAEDIGLISTKESDIQGQINELINEYLVAGLQLYAAKTKALKINVSNTDSNYIDIIQRIKTIAKYRNRWKSFTAALCSLRSNRN